MARSTYCATSWRSCTTNHCQAVFTQTCVAWDAGRHEHVLVHRQLIHPARKTLYLLTPVHISFYSLPPICLVDLQGEDSGHFRRINKFGPTKASCNCSPPRVRCSVFVTRAPFVDHFFQLLEQTENPASSNAVLSRTQSGIWKVVLQV